MNGGWAITAIMAQPAVDGRSSATNATPIPPLTLVVALTRARGPTRQLIELGGCSDNRGNFEKRRGHYARPTFRKSEKHFGKNETRLKKF
jgi:hypothetical protein